ncbi:unnamed protein product [Brassica oleracea]
MAGVGNELTRQKLIQSLLNLCNSIRDGVEHILWWNMFYFFYFI